MMVRIFSHHSSTRVRVAGLPATLTPSQSARVYRMGCPFGPGCDCCRLCYAMANGERHDVYYVSEDIIRIE